QLRTVGCDVTVVPAATTAADVLARKPDGVFLSNGPGDPEGVPYLIESVRGLLGRVPIFGICLGHQILGLAAGGRTYKLPFGHHGANHPVKDLATGRVEITTQSEASLEAHAIRERVDRRISVLGEQLWGNGEVAWIGGGRLDDVLYRREEAAPEMSIVYGLVEE